MYEQVKLSYGFDELEPAIDTLTMETHYGKHHATYTKTLNDLAEKAGVAGMPIEELLSNLSVVSDDALRTAIKNNGGGFYNHNLYFSELSPKPAEPSGALLAKINDTFGSVDELKAQLKTAALGQFGSGWAWLNADKVGNLTITKSPNQDNPFSEGLDVKPILALYVWEHAYYLKYKNLRADYIDAFFKVLDWDVVAKNYELAMK